MIWIKRFVIITGMLFFIPILFFVMGVLIGYFYPDIPRSNFYEYYWFMFPFLFPGGIFMVSCYLINIYIKAKYLKNLNQSDSHCYKCPKSNTPR